MSKIIDSIDFNTRRRIATFSFFVLALTTVHFTQGTILQQVMDLHLEAWPVIAVRNVFAVLAFFGGVGIIKNWI